MCTSAGYHDRLPPPLQTVGRCGELSWWRTPACGRRRRHRQVAVGQNGVEPLAGARHSRLACKPSLRQAGQFDQSHSCSLPALRPLLLLQKFPERFAGVYTKLLIFNLTQYERGEAGGCAGDRFCAPNALVLGHLPLPPLVVHAGSSSLIHPCIATPAQWCTWMRTPWRYATWTSCSCAMACAACCATRSASTPVGGLGWAWLLFGNLGVVWSGLAWCVTSRPALEPPSQSASLLCPSPLKA